MLHAHGYHWEGQGRESVELNRLFFQSDAPNKKIRGDDYPFFHESSCSEAEEELVDVE